MNLEAKILRESFGVLILASLISSLGGVALQTIESKILTILPLLILFPALNGMVGNFGTIFSSHYTTLLYQKKLGKEKLINKELKKQILLLIGVSSISAFYISTLASIVALFEGFEFDPYIYLKILSIALITTLFLVALISFIVIIAGRYYVKKKEDPDNVLVPITTAFGDLGAMIIFSLLVL